MNILKIDLYQHPVARMAQFQIIPTDLVKKVSAIAWKSFIGIGLLMAGMTSPVSQFDALQIRMDRISVLPNVQWLFPDRFEGYHKTPLEDLFICPIETLCFDKNELEDQTERVRVAKLSILEDPQNAARNFQKFGIKSQSAIVKLAKMCAKLDGLATSSSIQNFGIEKEADRIKIAWHCLLQNPDSAENIQNFAIRNQVALGLLYELNLQKVGALYFHKFKLKDQEVRRKYAELSGNVNCDETAKLFQNFRIKSEESRIQLAELFAKLNGGSIAKYFKNFAIHSQAAIVQIALLCAMQNGRETLKHIHNFGIHDQSALEAIHKVGIQQMLSVI